MEIYWCLLEVLNEVCVTLRVFMCVYVCVHLRNGDLLVSVGDVVNKVCVTLRMFMCVCVCI